MVYDEWRWMADGRHTAERNMAVDAALLADCEQGRVPPTIRLYSWSEPSITIGYSQKAEAELDITSVEFESADRALVTSVLLLDGDAFGGAEEGLWVFEDGLWRNARHVASSMSGRMGGGPARPL